MADNWNDVERILDGLRVFTIPELRDIIKTMHDEGLANMTRTGRKQDLIDRLVRTVKNFQHENRLDKWARVRPLLSKGATKTTYSAPTTQYSSYSAPRPTQYHNAGAIVPPASTSNLGRSYANAAAGSSSHSGSPSWKYSPFYRIEQAVSIVQECPESVNASDRKSQKFTFLLSADHIAKLAGRSPKYQLRLYCTSSSYHVPNSNFRQIPCPIEFPTTCEVRVNQGVVSANFRGIKKKAGTAPPADITTLAKRTQPGVPNIVEMIYVNSTQPASGKAQKYYMVVNLVQVTSVDELVSRLKNKVISKEEVVRKIQSDSRDDDDIQSGPTKMSLKDPLTYMRLQTPCRSRNCVHVQCFDAQTWYSMMEQTTTWLCPICEHALNVEDLIIDGFVDEILRFVDEDVEDVMVEADAEWHSIDNKYGSAAWTARHPYIPPADVKQSQKSHNSEDVLELDDSDDDDGVPMPVKIKRDPSDDEPTLRQTNGSSSNQRSNVIDLTIDSDDEDPPSAPPVRTAPSTTIGLPTTNGWAAPTSRPSTSSTSLGKRPQRDNSGSEEENTRRAQPPAKIPRREDIPPLSTGSLSSPRSHTTSSNGVVPFSPAAYPTPLDGYSTATSRSRSSVASPYTTGPTLPPISTHTHIPAPPPTTHHPPASWQHYQTTYRPASPYSPSTPLSPAPAPTTTGPYYPGNGYRSSGLGQNGTTSTSSSRLNGTSPVYTPHEGGSTSGSNSRYNRWP